MDKEQAAQKKMEALSQKMQQAGNDSDKQFAVVNDALTADPSMESTLGSLKLALLLKAQPDADTTLVYASHLTDDVYKDSAQELNGVAWSLVDPDQPKRSAKLYAVALKAAQHADELTQDKDAEIADTLGRAYFCSGDTAKAVEAQQRAVALTKGTSMGKDEITTITAYLEEYQKAANK